MVETYMTSQSQSHVHRSRNGVGTILNLLHFGHYSPQFVYCSWNVYMTSQYQSHVYRSRNGVGMILHLFHRVYDPPQLVYCSCCVHGTSTKTTNTCTAVAAFSVLDVLMVLTDI